MKTLSERAKTNDKLGLVGGSGKTGSEPYSLGKSLSTPMIRSYLDHVPTIPSSCYVDLSAQVIGDVELGEHSSVWMNAVLRGDVHSIRLGANSNVQDCAVLHGMRHKYPVMWGTG